MITIIDYGAGNLRSVVNAFDSLGHKTLVTSDPRDIAQASAIVLPGVGAFSDGMAMLRKLNLIEALNEQVLVNKKHYLGICLGLQFLAQESCEYGLHQGLGWVKGKVEKIVPNDKNFRVPHVGWNNIVINEKLPSLLRGIDSDSVFYFVHGYHLVVEDQESDVITSTCWHGTTITASLQKDNIYGVQFHPEKSQKNGLTLLKNFVDLL